MPFWGKSEKGRPSAGFLHSLHRSRKSVKAVYNPFYDELTKGEENTLVNIYAIDKLCRKKIPYQGPLFSLDVIGIIQSFTLKKQ